MDTPNAVQLHPFLSKHDEIKVPNDGKMIFRIKMTMPTDSLTSTSDSGHHGIGLSYLGTTPPATNGWPPELFSLNLSGYPAAPFP